MTRPLTVLAAVAQAVGRGAYTMGEIALAYRGTEPIIGRVSGGTVYGARFGGCGASIHDPFIGTIGTRPGAPWYTEAKVPGYEPRYVTKDDRSCVQHEFFADPDGPDQYLSNLAIGLPDIRQVYFCGVFKCEVGGDGPSRNVKPFAICGGSRLGWPDLPNVRFNCYPTQVNEAGAVSGHIYINDSSGNKTAETWWRSRFPWADGRWHMLEVWFNRDTNAYVVFFDSRPEVACHEPMLMGSLPLTQIYLGAYYAVDQNNAAAKWWWDDVELCAVSGKAKIVWGDAGRWEDCTRKVPLIPCSWDDTKIVLAESIPAGWVYVVNAEGEASRGCPVE